MTNSRARAGPARSASRCGPPIDGVSPTRTSTRPNCAPSAATSRSQASAISRPHVRHSACAAKTTGNGRSSMPCTSSKPRRQRSAPSSGLRSLKTLTSTPPVQTRPSARSSRPRGRSVGDVADRRVQALVDVAVEEVQRRLGDRQDGERAVLLECPGAEAGHARSASAASSSRSPPSPGDPGQSHRVVGVARDHVQVEVEHGLPGDRAARVDQVDAVGAERLGHALRQPLGRLNDGGELVGRDLEQVARVLLGDHERVAVRARVDVHEGDRPVVLVDLPDGQFAGDDLAEDAVGVGWPWPAGYPLACGAPWPTRSRRAPPGDDRARHRLARRARGRRVDRRSSCASLGADAHTESEQVHGGYWIPVGAPAAAAAGPGAAGAAPRWPWRAPGRARRRRGGCGVDPRRHQRRRAGVAPARCPSASRATSSRSPAIRDGDRTLVLVAHHDAGHGGAVFDHTLADTIEERWPGFIGQFKTYPPIMWPTVAGPIFTALGGLTGSRRLLGAGVAFGAGTAAAMADIARAPGLPGRQRQPLGGGRAARRRRGAARRSGRGRARAARLDRQRGVVHGGHAALHGPLVAGPAARTARRLSASRHSAARASR